MKHTWKRSQATIDLDAAGLAQILEPHFPGARVAGFRQISTGLVNTIYRVDLEPGHPPLCLKLGQRGRRSAAVEYAVCAALKSQFPVPEPLAFAPTNPVTGHPFAISAWVDGARLDVLSSELTSTAARAVTKALGTMLAELHRHRFDRTGLLDVTRAVGGPLGGVQVATPFRLDGSSLLEHVAQALLEGPGEVRIGVHVTRRLLDWLSDHAGRLDAVAHHAVLCHSDFGTENILLEGDRERERHRLWVLDWEFACAGTPYLDLGHLLRTPLMRAPAFERELEVAYSKAGGTLRADWAELARLTDLFAWLTFLSRESLPDAVTSAALGHIDTLLAMT